MEGFKGEMTSEGGHEAQVEVLWIEDQEEHSGHVQAENIGQQRAREGQSP